MGFFSIVSSIVGLYMIGDLMYQFYKKSSSSNLDFKINFIEIIQVTCMSSIVISILLFLSITIDGWYMTYGYTIPEIIAGLSCFLIFLILSIFSIKKDLYPLGKLLGMLCITLIPSLLLYVDYQKEYPGSFGTNGINIWIITYILATICSICFITGFLQSKDHTYTTPLTKKTNLFAYFILPFFLS